MALCSLSSAQTTPTVECPVVNIEVPKGLLPREGKAVFKVVIDPLDPEWRLKYRWHLSYGKIISGQDTPSITVAKPPSGTLTVIVDIGGFPKDSICLRTASQTVSWDAAPEPEKVATIRGALIEGGPPFTMEGVRGQLIQNPTNQLFVFLGFKPGTSLKSLAKREAQINDRLSNGIEKSRITIVRAEAEQDVTEFWRVPPGADIPKCDVCDTVKCPNISVTAPAGIVQPKEKFVFTGNLEGNVPPKAFFNWDVTGGRIVVGQGTMKIFVDADWNAGGATITATLTVQGLPDGCPKSASETGSVIIDPSPVLIDEFGRLTNARFKTRLSKFFAELQNNPNNQGYIINYGTEKEMKSRERLIVESVTFRGFDRSRITIVRAGEHESGKIYTKLYRIPPGADNPSP
ncbi:MAG: hypothetical protein IT174_05465 [Acidobacteria bacterium]|nr:hypothetical protein [Acidobacteriota bacterium]